MYSVCYCHCRCTEFVACPCTLFNACSVCCLSMRTCLVLVVFLCLECRPCWCTWFCNCWCSWIVLIPGRHRHSMLTSLQAIWKGGGAWTGGALHGEARGNVAWMRMATSAAQSEKDFDLICEFMYRKKTHLNHWQGHWLVYCTCKQMVDLQICMVPYPVF